MNVLDSGRFSVYVYDEVGQPHHLPHCHVRWEGNDTSVALPTLIVLAGKPLPKAAMKLLLANLDKIYEAWDQLNQRDN